MACSIRLSYTWIATCLVLTSLGAIAHEHHIPPWQEATAWPDRIVVTATSTPAHSFSVTWRTHRFVGETIAEIALATPTARFDLDADTIAARTEITVLDALDDGVSSEPVVYNQGLAPVHYHACTFDDLEPDTLYAYRVRGAQGCWSAWRQVRTAPLDGPIRFLYFGDAQTGIRSHVTRTFDTALRYAPAARFMIHGGDLVNKALYDNEWAQWFVAARPLLATVASLPAAGNHDYVNRDGEKLFIADRMVTPFWRQQFTLPVESSLPSDLHETVYTVPFGDLLQVFVVDSSGIAFDEQMAWLARGLESTPARWTVVTMHHPLYSFVGGTEHPSARERRLQLVPVLDRYKVDLVLTGHRHAYQRSESGDGVAEQPLGEAHAVDTVHVITASSTKRGETKVEGWTRYAEETQGRFSLSRYGDRVPIFAAVEVSREALRLEAVDPTGGVYDAFRLRKQEDGSKIIENAEAAFGPIFDATNTGPYRSWDELR